MLTLLPKFAQKYFWGDDLDQLNWQSHQKYITQTLLDKGDAQAISWLMKQLPKETLKKTIPNIKLTPKSRNFWELYFS